MANTGAPHQTPLKSTFLFWVVSVPAANPRYARIMGPWERWNRKDATRGVVVAEAHLQNFGELLICEFFDH